MPPWPRPSPNRRPHTPGRVAFLVPWEASVRSAPGGVEALPKVGEFLCRAKRESALVPSPAARLSEAVWMWEPQQALCYVCHRFFHSGGSPHRMAEGMTRVTLRYCCMGPPRGVCATRCVIVPEGRWRLPATTCIALAPSAEHACGVFARVLEQTPGPVCRSIFPFLYFGKNVFAPVEKK